MGDISQVWHRALTSGLDKLRIGNTLCDTIIATSDGESLHSHACVLAAASPVLQASFVKIAERCYLVNIPGIPCDVWKLLLQFIYRGAMDANYMSSVDSISSAAETLQLPQLQQFLETFKKQAKTEVDNSEDGQSIVSDESQGKGDCKIAFRESGGKTIVLKMDMNKTTSEGQGHSEEAADEEGKTEGEVEDNVNVSNDNDVSYDELHGDPSSDLGATEEAETCSMGELEKSSGRTSDVQVKPTDDADKSKDCAARTLRHECDACGRRFRYRSAMMTHARIHTDEKPFACGECDMKFGNRTVLKNHMLTHTTVREIFQCDQCEKCFLTKSGLWQHRRSHKRTTATTCTTCDKQLDSMEELHQHLVNEHNRKLFACTECHKMFESKAALTTHTATHTGEKEFPCTECGQSFDQFNALKCHQRLHAGQKKYSCEQCGAGFETRCGYKAHAKRHSAGQEQFPCTCGKVYTTERGLRYHRQHHHQDGDGGKKLSCSICQEEFESSADLSEHKASEHSRRYLCGECGNTFSTPGALLRHTLIHTGEKPFACMTCGRAFRTRGTLVAHERCHTGEKPFQCPTCDARFRIRNALTIHKRIHTGERPYECSVCGARFRSRTLQVAHQQRHHAPSSQRRHVCAKCGKIFLSRGTLREHELRNHTDDPALEESRRCVCTLCGKVVAHAASLRSHMYVHMKKKLYQCIQCESAFRRNSDLKRHLRQVHGYEVVPDAATITESQADSSHVICEPVLEQEHLGEETIVFTANL